ncbi:MAG: anti-sigma factor [Methylobacterium sp.]|jgi:hypothetical protein|nr:anti-sigma factor [Methylobacterium sp.]MCA3652233.1 anti-sigma factor [Methylobacterium sp.]
MSNGHMGPPADDSANQTALSDEPEDKLQDMIGRALQAHYRALVQEPIPDRLIDLLAELEAGRLSHE